MAFGLVELEGGLGELQMIERKASVEGEPTMRGGHEGTRGHRNEGGSGIAGLDFEAMPESGGDLAQFAFGDEMEIKEDEREISVTQEEIGALEGLLGFGTAEPDEMAAFFISIRGGIEAVAPIDKGEREVAFFVEELGNDEGGSGGMVWGDDFVEMSGGKFEGSSLMNGLFGNGGTMSGRELLTKLTAELVDLQDAQNMFIRTLIEAESRRWRSNIKWPHRGVF